MRLPSSHLFGSDYNYVRCEHESENSAIALAGRADAQTFYPLAAAACDANFSWGENYRDTAGSGAYNNYQYNGVLFDQWFVLARWQGENEANFKFNTVSYDPSAATGLSGGTKKGVTPEQTAGSALVQRDCYSTGFLINTWTTPHRPIAGGGYNDMFGYAWTTPPYAFVRGGYPADLVIQSEIAVPHFAVWDHNTGDSTNAQIGFYAYLRDASNPTYPPIVVLAMTHMSNYTPSFRLSFFDYINSSYPNDQSKSSTYQNSNYPNWQMAVNNPGVCFFSASIESANAAYLTPGLYGGYSGYLTSALTTSGATNKHFRVHITPSNLTAIVDEINNGGSYANCPFRPGYYSNSASDYKLEYAGVIAEVAIGGTNFDTSHSSWVGKNNSYDYNDTSKAQVSLGVKLYDTGVLQYQ